MLLPSSLYKTARKKTKLFLRAGCLSPARCGDVDILRLDDSAVWRSGRRMVRLLVRKSLLSAWTTSRLYGRRRAGSGWRYVPRRTVASAVTAGDDHGTRDFRPDVLFVSCCCCGDDTRCPCCCCCCCVTDEECQGKLTRFFFAILLNARPASHAESLMFCRCYFLLSSSFNGHLGGEFS